MKSIAQHVEEFLKEHDLKEETTLKDGEDLTWQHVKDDYAKYVGGFGYSSDEPTYIGELPTAIQVWIEEGKDGRKRKNAERLHKKEMDKKQDEIQQDFEPDAVVPDVDPDLTVEDIQKAAKEQEKAAKEQDTTNTSITPPTEEELALLNKEKEPTENKEKKKSKKK